MKILKIMQWSHGDPSVHMWPRASPTWRHSAKIKANTPRPTNPSIHISPRAWRAMLHYSDRPSAAMRQRGWWRAPKQSVRSLNECVRLARGQGVATSRNGVTYL